MPLPPFTSNGLLPDGLHPATQNDLQERCVTPFPKSVARKTVFSNFCRYQKEVSKLGIHATQWVNGSFVDQSRVEPDDVDVASFLHADDLNGLKGIHQWAAKMLLAGGDTTKDDYSTHSFLIVKYPPGHKFEPKFEAMRKYWRKWFATAREYEPAPTRLAPHRGPKGIVKMHIGNATLAPVVEEGV